MEDSLKQRAIAFYRTAFEGDPRSAVDRYVGDRYIQHNPAVADGKEGFIAYFERMQREYPVKSINFLRAVEEGDLVALHTLQVWPANDRYVTMDFFRFDEQGKIVEHWDAIQGVPDEMEHDNGMS
ncbi:nuclear transport factor 2 family protein [Lewinella sp. IMCC34191]|uniref:nuclear transport factor 2 family protein n=1 Tax=Lewinella sp. IMCC34191 TaxID=2259172 RepID=UPI000E27DEBA|nr:nuclear transport factor 2 family protein [Lewinella sp. IMCC34191]